MLLSSQTNRTVLATLAAAALGSAFLFACGSDETNPADSGSSAGTGSGTGVGGSTLNRGGATGNGGSSLNRGGANTGVGGNTGLGGATGASGAPGSTCVGGVQTGSSCNPDVDVETCVRGNRSCDCLAAGTWTCTTNGVGGATGVGGRGQGGAGVGGRGLGVGGRGLGQGGAGVGGRGLGQGGVGVGGRGLGQGGAGVGGRGLGQGGAGVGGRGQGGSGGRGQGGAAGAAPTTTCNGNVQTGTDCNPTADTTTCIRNNRTCECQADSNWLCTPTGGVGGAGGGGGVSGVAGSTSVAGASALAACPNGVFSNQTCTAGAADCTRRQGGNDVTCSCGPNTAGTEDIWTCG